MEKCNFYIFSLSVASFPRKYFQDFSIIQDIIIIHLHSHKYLCKSLQSFKFSKCFSQVHNFKVAGNIVTQNSALGGES